MKIAIASCGTRGDVQPLIALSLALQKRGHGIIFIAPPENEPLINRYVANFVPMGENMQEFVNKTPNPSVHPIKAMRRLRDFLRRQTKIQLSELWSHFDASDCVLIATFMCGARTVAEKLNRPYKFIAFCPQIIPSPSYPALFIKNHHLGRLFNKVSWRLMSKMTNSNLKKIVNEKRESLGLQPASDIYNHFLGDNLLVACDKELGEVPSDTQKKWKQCGYPFLRQQAELPDEVIDFIKRGSKPIYVGFGSMPSDDPVTFTQFVKEAAHKVGRRLILSKGWAHLGGKGDSDDRLLVVGKVPHDKLFQHVDCVVHHGGAGTTTTAARAGVPQLVVPHMTDQFYWGERVFEKGLGPKPIFHSRLSYARFNSALSDVLSNDLYKKKALEMQKMLCEGEDRKIAAMVSYIEAMV